MKKIAVTLITGHLGSGKTTFIQNILDSLTTEKVLVIENEFGEIGIDGELLAQNKNALVELNQGCICCNIQSELEVILERYIAEQTKFDHIIIEATGVANPAKIARLFIAPQYLSQNFELNSVISVVDALHFNKHRDLAEFELQLLTSDSFYISKNESIEDLSTRKDREEQIIQELGLHSHRNLTHLSVSDWFFKDNFNILDENISLKGGHNHYQKIAFEFEGEFDPFSLENYLNILYLQYMGKIIRSKGILHFRKAPHPVTFQGVFDSLSFKELTHRREVIKKNQLVFIGNDLNEDVINTSLRNCLAE